MLRLKGFTFEVVPVLGLKPALLPRALLWPVLLTLLAYSALEGLGLRPVDILASVVVARMVVGLAVGALVALLVRDQGTSGRGREHSASRARLRL